MIIYNIINRSLYKIKKKRKKLIEFRNIEEKEDIKDISFTIIELWQIPFYAFALIFLITWLFFGVDEAIALGMVAGLIGLIVTLIFGTEDKSSMLIGKDEDDEDGIERIKKELIKTYRGEKKKIIIFKLLDVLNIL